MKIVDMRITPCRIPLEAPLHYSWGAHPAFIRIVVELVTDDGLVGLGECYGDTIRLQALENAKSFVLGADPYDLEKLRWQIMPPGQVKLFNGAVVYHSYAAVEFACLDLIGQSVGRPVSDLLGGRLRDKIHQSAYVFYRYPNEDGVGEIHDADALVAYAGRLIDDYGFKSIKFKNGVFDPDIEVEHCIALREAFPKLKIRMDPNGAWAIGTAVRVAKKLNDYELEYLEDPTWTLRGLARVAKQSPGIVIASNQAVFSFEDLAPNQIVEGVDVVLADPHWYGGMTAIKVLGRMAEAYGFDIGMHSGSEFGISQAAQIHCAAAVGNVANAYAADTHYPHLTDDVILGGRLPIVDGCFEVPTTPGIGVRLDPERVGKYHEEFLSKGFANWTVDPFDPNPSRLPIVPRF